MQRTQDPPTRFAITVAVFWFLYFLALLFVVPKFERIFMSMLGSFDPLPFFTKLVVAIPNVLRVMGLVLMPAAIIGKEWLVDEDTARMINWGALVVVLLLYAGTVLAVFIPILQLQAGLANHAA